MPKIVVPDTETSAAPPVKFQRNRSQTQVTSLNKITKRTSEPGKPTIDLNKQSFTSLTNLCLNEPQEESLDQIVIACINDLLDRIEVGRENCEEAVLNSTIFNNSIEMTTSELPEISFEKQADYEEINSGLIIDTCLMLLKQLFHTFVTTHLFMTENKNDSNEIQKSFQSLFNFTTR